MPWNLALVSGFQLTGKQQAEEAQALRTCLVAFERSDWEWFESEFVQLQGRDDIAMCAVKMMHARRLVSRYDVLYPVDSASLRLWTLCPDPPPSACLHCKEEKKLFKCSGCLKRCYCSVECQAAHWKQHRDMCKMPAMLVPAEEVSRVLGSVRDH